MIEAQAISETGWITGRGEFDRDGAGPAAAYPRVFLMQVPEPSVIAPLLLLATLLARRGK